MSEIKVNKVSSRTGNAVTLGNTSDTLTVPSGVTITAAGTVSGNFKDIQWQSVITADGSTNTTAEAGKGYFIDTTSATHTINLPASPSTGDTVAIVDAANTFNTNNVTVGRNGSNIESSASDDTIAAFGANKTYVYINSTIGWKKVNNDGTDPGYIEATGGTATTSGNYKMHAFTSSSNFVVSSTGNGAGSNVLDYLVVAGGGAGSRTGGGGGAGGFRISNQLNTPGASPLASSTGIEASVTTYPITVGAGGSAVNVDQTVSPSGANSVFSTITSAGGGGAHSYASTSPGIGANGGSGGGGGTADGSLGGPAAGGSGNTPPVSPSQGNSGGNGSPTRGGGAGGGAGAAGANSPGNNNGGAGGIGSFAPTDWTSSLGEPGPSGRYFAGGGSGTQPSGTVAGGLGGGGDGGPNPGTPGKAGVANTGGGGGGTNDSGNGTGGGSGIVIIRYKYQ